MAATQVGIINLGLSHIGQTPIVTMVETTVQREAASRVWEYILKEVLASYNWGFARVTLALTVLSNYTSLIYTYAYTYPSSCVRVWKVYGDGSTEHTIGVKFRVLYDTTNNQKVIVTDLEDAYAEYTHFQETVTEYDPYFITALSHRLAAELAVPLNGDPEMAKGQIAIFNNLIKEAHRFSAHESKETKQANEKSDIVDARG